VLLEYGNLPGGALPAGIPANTVFDGPCTLVLSFHFYFQQGETMNTDVVNKTLADITVKDAAKIYVGFRIIAFATRIAADILYADYKTFFQKEAK